MERSLRGPLCMLTLLGYHTVVAHAIGQSLDSDVIVFR